MAEVQELAFEQKDKSKHVYTTENGYIVEVNKDRKTWSAKGPDGKDLGNKHKNRADAVTAANADAFPEHYQAPAKKEETAEAPKRNPISAREHLVLKKINDAGGPLPLNDVIEQSGLDQAVVMGVISSLARRKMIVLTAEGSKIVDIGLQVLANYDESLVKSPVVRTEDPKSAEEKMIAKFGPRPEGIGPRPSWVEYFTVNQASARASRDMALVVQRLHPHSPHSEKRVKSANERLEAATKNLNGYRVKAKLAPVDVEGNEISAETPAATS